MGSSEYEQFGLGVPPPIKFVKHWNKRISLVLCFDCGVSPDRQSHPGTASIYLCVSQDIIKTGGQYACRITFVDADATKCSHTTLSSSPQNSQIMLKLKKLIRHVFPLSPLHQPSLHKRNVKLSETEIQREKSHSNRTLWPFPGNPCKFACRIATWKKNGIKPATLRFWGKSVRKMTAIFSPQLPGGNFCDLLHQHDIP